MRAPTACGPVPQQLLPRLFTGRVFSKELSIPTKPLDVTAEIITAGSIGLLWQAPNNTGGEGIDYYEIFVGQLAGTWEQVSCYCSVLLVFCVL